MGKVKAWLMEMEDYALETSKEEFLKKYPSEGDVWESVKAVIEEEYPDRDTLLRVYDEQ